MSQGQVRYSGRVFTEAEIDQIRTLIQENPKLSRVAISRRVCELTAWTKPDGTPRDMSCRVALLRMAADGLIKLPKPRRTITNRLAPRRVYAFLTEPQPVLAEPAGAFKDLHLEIVDGRAWSTVWGDFMDRYHYLGYQPFAGAQLRYFVKARGQVLALLAFAASAWKTAPRDDYIGWSAEQRERNLHLVVGNARFLILPWVHSRNLASRILALAARQLPVDWDQRYGYRPVLLETFVDQERFRGTCYQAAGWTRVGVTTGRGKKDRDHLASQPVKTVWLLPLCPDFRQTLCP